MANNNLVTVDMLLDAVRQLKQYHDNSSNKTHTQEILTESDEWVIQHNLKTQYPSKVYVFDSDGHEIQFPNITYNTENLLTINFDVPIMGKVIVIA